MFFPHGESCFSFQRIKRMLSVLQSEEFKIFFFDGHFQISHVREKTKICIFKLYNFFS